MATTKAARRKENLAKVEKLVPVLEGMAPGTGQALHELLVDLAASPVASKTTKK